MKEEHKKGEGEETYHIAADDVPWTIRLSILVVPIVHHDFPCATITIREQSLPQTKPRLVYRPPQSQCIRVLLRVW